MWQSQFHFQLQQLGNMIEQMERAELWQEVTCTPIARDFTSVPLKIFLDLYLQ